MLSTQYNSCSASTRPAQRWTGGLDMFPRSCKHQNATVLEPLLCTARRIATYTRTIPPQAGDDLDPATIPASVPSRTHRSYAAPAGLESRSPTHKPFVSLYAMTTQDIPTPPHADIGRYDKRTMVGIAAPQRPSAHHPPVGTVKTTSEP